MATKKIFAEEIIRVNKVKGQSKFTKALADNILIPILNRLDSDLEDLMQVIGEFIINHLRDNILQHEPSGREYQIILVSDGGDNGKFSYTPLGTYTASAPGEPPASFHSAVGVPTGTLFNSIDFEIDENGKLKVGVFKSVGTEYQSMMFHGDKLFVVHDGGLKTSVEVYGNALDTGVDYKNGKSVSARPWFREEMNKLRPQIRKMLQKQLKESLKRATKRKTKIHFQVYFDNKKTLDSTKTHSSGVGRIMDEA